MTTAASHAEPMNAARTMRPSRAAALLSLMDYYEQDVVDDAGESETELMVLLSGMVAVDLSLTVGD